MYFQSRALLWCFELNRGVICVIVQAHNTADSTWITINDEVFDVSTFADGHPGGEKLLRDFGGKDATSDANLHMRLSSLLSHAYFV